MSKIILAMSGGVDSSVCAALLKRAGHTVFGAFMRHGISSSSGDSVRRKHGCCSAEDAEDAQKIADLLQIPLKIFDFHDEFEEIVDYFAREYASCRTPNPCVVCNMKLKFGKLFDYADDLGADFVATGHYARVRDGGIFLGADPGKDQSYVLHRIPRHRIPRLMFPIGEFRKDEIRRMAEEFGLPVAHKPDSQEICFIPDDDHATFVREYFLRKNGAYPDTSGHFVTTSGVDRGPHLGLERYTIGQRKGLGLSFPVPHFVIRLEPDTRRVILGPHEELARSELVATDANWLSDVPSGPFECQVKIRYRTPAMPAVVTPDIAQNSFRVHFHAPIFGIAPGQAAVCYSDSQLLGGGWIDTIE